MGGEESKPTYRSNFFKEFPPRYRQLRTTTDKVYGSGIIWQKNDQSSLVFQQSLTSQSKQKFKPLNLDHPNIISCLGIRTQDDGAMCSDGYVSQIHFPFYDKTLAKETEVRYQRYSEPEIWYVFNSLVQANAYLQSQNVPHTDIRPQQILLTPNGQLKLAPYGTFPRDITGYLRALNFGQLVYLAPEQLYFLARKVTNPQYNQTLADVFGLGITLLELMSKVHAQHFYNFTTIEIDEQAIKNALDESLKSYSMLLVSLVATIFTKTPEKRPDFIQLQTILQPYQEQINTLQPFDFDLEDAKTKLSFNLLVPNPPQQRQFSGWGGNNQSRTQQYQPQPQYQPQTLPQQQMTAQRNPQQVPQQTLEPQYPQYVEQPDEDQSGYRILGLKDNESNTDSKSMNGDYNDDIPRQVVYVPVTNYVPVNSQYTPVQYPAKVPGPQTLQSLAPQQPVAYGQPVYPQRTVSQVQPYNGAFRP